MRDVDESYAPIVHAALMKTSISNLLMKNWAVVLERTARGGGAVNWYYCHDKNTLPAIERMLSPGAVVSFYFDQRIRKSHYSSQVRSDIEKILMETGDVTIGILETDVVRIDATLIVSITELAEFAETVSPAVELFFGAFPARDNDGTRAVTVILPDLDGVIRAHPH